MPQFEEGNQEARKRGKNKRTLWLKALMGELNASNPDKAEEEFYKICIKIALGTHEDVDKPDTQLLKDCLARLYPQSKPTLPTFSLDMPKGLDRLGRIEFIVDSCVNGELPADIQSHLTTGLANVATVEDVELNGKRLDALEKAAGLS